MYKLPAKSHGDGTGGNLSNAGDEDNGGADVSAGQPCGEGKWDSETVGNAENDVTDNLTGHEVLLFVVVKNQHLLLQVTVAIFLPHINKPS